MTLPLDYRDLEYRKFVEDSGNVAVRVYGSLSSGKTPLTPSSPTFATVGASSSEILASNTNRKGLIIINTSSNNVSFGLGVDAVLYSGITLTPYGTWVMDDYTFTTSSIKAIASVGSTNVAIQELT